jgi:hypothetical protein
MLVEEARRAAAENATQEPLRRAEDRIKQILKGQKHKSLSKVKDSIEMARKPKMRTVEQFLCDQCDKVIAKPEDGFIIHGNIYVADPTCRGGLIGNNIPEVAAGEKIDPEAIKQTVLCKHCLLKSLNMFGNPFDKMDPSEMSGLLARKSNRRWNLPESVATGRDNPYQGESSPY